MVRMTDCRACKGRNLYLFMQMGSHPPANRFLTEDQLDGPEPSFPLDAYACLDCGLIQIPDQIPADFFRHYLYVPSASDTMHRHFAALADRICHLPGDVRAGLVVDIGCNDGLFLRACLDRGLRTLGIEPAANLAAVARDGGIEVVNDYFTPAVAAAIRERYGAARVIVTTNTFNHIGDLHRFTGGGVPGPIVVTGGAGFIGSHLVRRLVAEGAEVHVLSRPGHHPWRLADIAEEIVTWPGDVTEPEGVRRCLEGARPRVVYHLAATTDVRHPASDLSDLTQSIDVNLTGTLNVLRAVLLAKAPVEAVIRTGGLEEYGNGPAPSRESQREAPVSSYSASQVAAAHYCQMLQPRLPFAVVTLRLALVYGPGQSPAFFIPALIRSCLRGEDFAMTDGQQGRDLIYVEDVVGALLSAARAPGAAGQIINVSTGVERRLLDVAELIIDLCGTRIPLLVGGAPHRPAEIHHLCGAVDKACGILGWRAVTPLRTGLERTVGWYRRHS